MAVLGQGGNYLKTDQVAEGDVLTFKDEGTWVESKFAYPDGNPKQEFIMGVEHKGQNYSMRIGKFSQEELIPVYGKDTAKWVGRKAKITIETYRSLNKKGIILKPYEDKEAKEEQEAWDADA